MEQNNKFFFSLGGIQTPSPLWHLPKRRSQKMGIFRYRNNGRQVNVFLTTEDSSENMKDNKVEVIHKALQPILFVALFAGIMPLYGISEENSREIRFKWMSLRLIINVVLILSVMVFLISMIDYYNINSKSIGQITFYFVSTSSMICLIILARKWKKLMCHWSEVSVITGFGGDETIIKLKQITTTILILALTEHGLANINAYFNLPKLEKGTSALEIFFLHKFIFLFKNIEYCLWKGVIAWTIHFQATIAWNFTDLIIINVATALGDMFKSYYKDLEKSKDKVMPILYWQRKREEYCELAALVKSIDNDISNLVLLSFGCNLFFICMQLYHTLRSKQSFVKDLYFMASFSYLLLRTICVCLSGANMYEYSKKPLKILYATSSEQFNVEIYRLLENINGETLALSGYNCFTLNRGLVLTVAGTIATYEIVLVQFNSFNE